MIHDSNGKQRNSGLKAGVHYECLLKLGFRYSEMP